MLFHNCDDPAAVTARGSGLLKRGSSPIDDQQVTLSRANSNTVETAARRTNGSLRLTPRWQRSWRQNRQVKPRLPKRSRLLRNCAIRVDIFDKLDVFFFETARLYFEFFFSINDEILNSVNASTREAITAIHNPYAQPNST